MQEFLDAVLSYPTVFFTVLLAAAFMYWVLVIVGAMGIDVLDIDFEGASEGVAEGAAEGAAEGLAEGAAEGVAEGAAEGLAEGAAEGAAEGVAEGATEGAAEGASEGGAGVLAGLFYALKLRSVPLTLVLSLVIMLGWVMCFMGTRYLIMGMGLGPTWLIGTALLASSIIVAFPITSVLVRPLAHVLKVEKPVSRHDLVGQVVRIDTSRVDHRFGMARAEDGGAGLIVQVRCDAEANGLTRGSSALVVSYDHRREVYEVTPFDDILPSKRSADA
ncbi:MAG: glycine zipper family protein [Myxococcales bacterium]|nr:glycine zipper family protein [Myxococcales bacterium]MCB9714617.1 glycine zipper family protein [Myxococcales bacterium]